jgi:hypothetical protein
MLSREIDKKTRYEYDQVFPQHSSQEQVFEAVQPLCISVLDGFNVCIFAYGQTGSGKTFTMEGSKGDKYDDDKYESMCESGYWLVKSDK